MPAREIVRDNPDAVDDYLIGEDGAVNYLVGQVMAASGGAMDPGEATRRVKGWLAVEKAERVLANYPFCPHCDESLSQALALAENPLRCEETSKPFTKDEAWKHVPLWALAVEIDRHLDT